MWSAWQKFKYLCSQIYFWNLYAVYCNFMIPSTYWHGVKTFVVLVGMCPLGTAISSQLFGWSFDRFFLVGDKTSILLSAQDIFIIPQFSEFSLWPETISSYSLSSMWCENDDSNWSTGFLKYAGVSSLNKALISATKLY